MTSWVPFDLLDHLWQSTLFTAAVWLVARAVRTNAARVRYWLWFAASVKFLIPVSVLVLIGERFAWRTTPAAASPAVSFVIDQVLTPVATTVGTAPSAPDASPTMAIATLLLVVWCSGVGFVLSSWWRQWLPLNRARRHARAIEVAALCDAGDLQILASPLMVEPGIFGIRSQVLLVPEGITDRLTPAQLRALVAHERCHVRHRDNLTAGLHMVVEALFWFYPVVWWIERRLIEERERACDEYVLQSGSNPRDYAEGILEVCKWAKEPPLACVAGVSGGDLRRRIESILRDQIGRPTTIGERLALTFGMLTLIAMPIAAGAMNAEMPLVTVGQDPDVPVVFEVASVRLNRSGERSATLDERRPGGGFGAINTPLRLLITHAYQISNNQLIGAPEWISSERFDIDAKLDHDPPAVQAYRAGARQFALRSLLADRFKLVVHRETREVPMYALVMARADRKPGPKLTPSTTDCTPETMNTRIASAQAGKPVLGMCGSRFNSGRIRFGGYPLSDFVKVFSYDGRSVVDRTGLTGPWDLELSFTPDGAQAPSPGQDAPVIDPNAPSLPAALQEQLGLKLESITGPLEVLVVDHVERPSEN